MSLSATLDVGEAIDTRWDVVIVGAGPAGAVAAYQLARSGLSALLVERKEFPRRKVCGACLNLSSVFLLQQLGLKDILDPLQALPLESFHLQSGGKRVTISLPGGVAVTRVALDAALVQRAIEEGAHFLPATSASLDNVSKDGRSRHVALKQQGGTSEIIAAKVVLIADGLGHSSLRHRSEFHERVSTHSHVGLGISIKEFPSTYEEGTIFMAVARQGYAGLVRVEDGSLNIAAAVDRRFVKSFPQPADAVAASLQQAGFPPIKAITSAPCQGTIQLTRNTLRPASQRTLLLGDAAGYVEPFTGEGMAMAMTCGVAAAELVVRRIHDWNREDEDAWVRLYRRHVKDRLHWCRRLAWLLRHPSVVQTAVRLVARFPSMARPLVRRLNESPAEIISGR